MKNEAVDLFWYEKKYYDQNIADVAGIDEVGRGPLAGPVVAAAVILPPGLVIDGLNDSKKLSEKRRELLGVVVRENAIGYHIAEVDWETIDAINILNATKECMRRAVAGLMTTPGACLVDGNFYPLALQGECIVKGDTKSASIMAASILAKVYRDRLMRAYEEEYPAYRFGKNKGYGTREHMQAIRQHGLCPIHRRSFVKKLI